MSRVKSIEEQLLESMGHKPRIVEDSGTPGVILKSAKAEMAQDTAEFVEKIQDMYRKNFPKGKFVAGARNGLGSTYIMLFTGILPDGKQTNGYLENDPAHHKFSFDVKPDGSMMDKIEIDAVTGGSLSTNPEAGSHMAMGRVKFGWRKKAGNQAQVLKHLDAYFKKMRSVVDSNKDNIYGGSELIETFIVKEEDLPADVIAKIKANNDKMTDLKKNGGSQEEIDALEKENDELNGGNKTFGESIRSQLATGAYHKKLGQLISDLARPNGAEGADKLIKFVTKGATELFDYAKDKFKEWNDHQPDNDMAKSFAKLMVSAEEIKNQAKYFKSSKDMPTLLKWAKSYQQLVKDYNEKKESKVAENFKAGETVKIVSGDHAKQVGKIKKIDGKIASVTTKKKSVTLDLEVHTDDLAPLSSRDKMDMDRYGKIASWNESIDEATKDQVKKQMAGIKAAVQKNKEMIAAAKAKKSAATDKEKKEKLKNRIYKLEFRNNVLRNKYKKVKATLGSAKSKEKEVKVGNSSVDSLKKNIEKAKEKARHAEDAFQDNRNDNSRKKADAAHTAHRLAVRKYKAAKKIARAKKAKKTAKAAPAQEN